MGVVSDCAFVSSSWVVSVPCTVSFPWTVSPSSGVASELSAQPSGKSSTNERDRNDFMGNSGGLSCGPVWFI